VILEDIPVLEDIEQKEDFQETPPPPLQEARTED